MKRNAGNRAIAAILLVVMSVATAFGQVPIQAFAQDTTENTTVTQEEVDLDSLSSEYGQMQGIYVDSLQESNETEDGLSVESVRVMSDATTTSTTTDWTKYSSDYYYNQLTTDEQTFYDRLEAICQQYINSTTSVVNQYTGTYYLDSVNYGDLDLTDSEVENVLNIFYQTESQYYFLKNSYIYTTDAVALTIYNLFADGSTRYSYTQKFLDQINTWEDEIATCTTYYTKEKKAHDIIDQSISYDYNSGAYSQSAISGVLNDGPFQQTTVAAGFAKIFQILCNAAGIETITVTSSTHQWNYIILYGIWYQVDCMLDKPYYSSGTAPYLNISDTTMNTADKGATTHTALLYWTSYLPDCERDFIAETDDTPCTIILSHYTISLEQGRTTVLEAKGLQDDPFDVITFSSDDPSIATVDGNGTITGVSMGTTMIVATNNEYSTSCKVTITESKALTSVTMDQTQYTQDVGGTTQLGVTYAPTDTSDDTTITWSSSNETVATVDQTGLVTVVGAGTATISAQMAGFTVQCVVTGTIPLTGASLDMASATINQGETIQLNASPIPSNTTDDTSVTWSSSNKKVATVDSTGIVTAVGPGTATIVAKIGDFTASCEVTVEVPLTGITMSQSTASIKPAGTTQLKVNYTPTNTTDDTTVTWTSSDETIATVSSAGKVTGVSLGKATITATVGEFTTTCQVTVEIPLTGITMSPTTAALKPGQTTQLTATCAPSNTTDDTTVTWTSSNTSIATVDSTGIVTAVGVGSATITATAGSFSATCKVTVSIPLTGISLDQTTATMEPDKSIQLKVSYSPIDTTDSTTVTWTSSNTKVATVDSTGKVTSVGGGTATITAKVGTYTATCKVTVVIPLTGITLNQTSTTLNKAKTAQLSVTYAPTTTTDSKTITWTSSDTSVATVTTAGKVTAVGAGTTTITATVGTFTATCKVTVVIPLTGIKLSKSTLSITKGESSTLTATISPTNTTDDATITWTSSDPSVATVDKNGKITALATGTTTITSTVGSYSATCKVTVVIPLTAISLNQATVSIAKGLTTQLNVVYNPDDTTDSKTVKWTTSNSKIATVDSTGKVTAVAAGSATITATVGTLKATSAVTVIIPLTSITLNQTQAELKYNATTQLSVTYAPTTTTESKTVTWSSSDEKVATVDENGLVTAVGSGTAIITAKATDSNTTATCQVVVEPITIVNPTTVYNGVDYADVYNPAFYAENNADVYAAFGDDGEALIAHFVNYGMAEGRYAKEDFNVVEYMYGLLNEDLHQAFGGNMVLYYMHYINYGKAEGRSVSDWDTVFDAKYYLDNNPDVKANIVSRYTSDGNLYGWALWHYCEYGANEGRRGNSTFGVYNYEAANQDIYEAFGSNLKAATINYIQYGQNRLITPLDDYDMYNMAAIRPDVVKAFGNNQMAWVTWYINYGSKGY